MPVDELARQAELGADLSDLVLEQVAQRFDELEMHALGQAADVVMRLDEVGLTRRRSGRFDDIGVDRSLREPANVIEPRGVLLEYLDELGADDLAVGLRVSYAVVARHE